jgi:flagellar basal body-associated protein FliL
MIKKLLPVVLGLMLAGGGFFAYTMFFSGGGKVETPVQAQTKALKVDATAKKKRLKDKIEGKIASLGDPFVVNLADPGLSAFVKLDVSVLVDTGTPFEAAAADAAAGAPKLEEWTEIRDLVIDVINSHSSADLAKPEGRTAAKEEIIKAINDRTRKTVALEVYFPTFAIQQQPQA